MSFFSHLSIADGNSLGTAIWALCAAAPLPTSGYFPKIRGEDGAAPYAKLGKK
jgi:hypothetical protein